jgi:UDP-N-acetylmuramoyl-L-alanyl-D-glutamate--2,6-diaminopimelate ligase
VLQIAVKKTPKRVALRIISMTSNVTPKLLSEFDSKIFRQDIGIKGIAINANDVKDGFLFVALAGANTHGSNFLETAINNGAAAVLSDIELNSAIPSFMHPKPRQIVGDLASWFYGFPFNSLSAVGITGTNGKTTCASLIKQIWDINKIDSALIGTLGVEIGKDFVKGARTTPEADELQKIAFGAKEKGIRHLVMEVSSHAIDQFRIQGCKYKVVAFTNLSQDHLDYHKTMENYFEVKAKLFTQDYAEMAVINIDSKYGKRLFSEVKIPAVSISRNDKTADWFYEKVNLNSDGYLVDIRSKLGNVVSGNFNLKGDFNLENLLLSVASTSLIGLSDGKLLNTIDKLKAVSGRLEQIAVGQKFTALVDYAHTPDAVSRVLKSVRSFTKGRIIGVLGCGGERDAGKRPLMGSALLAGSDIAIFTSDNPRGEAVEKILSQMTNGLKLSNKGFVISDRKAAIKFACEQAVPGDCVVLLGKGHEVGQEVNGVVIPFDDRVELANAIKQVV